MNTETLKQPASQLDVTENKINYLWLNGERVIGIEGLEIFEDCRQLHHLPAIKTKQREELNDIINSTLQQYTEEGIYNNWSGLVTKAKDYFSEQGYCVIKQDTIKIELKQSVEPVSQSFIAETITERSTERNLTVADLWNIHRLRRAIPQRRYIV